MTTHETPPARPEILCCGEALIDMLPRRTRDGETAFLPVCGGAIFNTAIALGRLGVGTQFFGGLSQDMFGQKLRAALGASGVGAGLCPPAPHPTTLAFVSLDNGQARYTFYDENTAGRMLGVADLPALPAAISLLFLGGISLIPKPCADAYEALAQRHAGRRLIMLDPNIRAGFVSDAASYRTRLTRMIALADIVKVSDEDLAWIFGPGDPAARAEGLLAMGPRLVLLTEGAKGASAFCRAGQVSAPAPKADVVDTVGAGDTFNAGVLAALAERGALTRDWIEALDSPGFAGAQTLRAACTLGCRAAAVTVARAGANPPRREEL